jgi:hypothetical protein
VIAFKAAQGGDSSAIKLRQGSQSAGARALASGSYTFWVDDAAGVGHVVTEAAADSVKACIVACELADDCAAVVMKGLASNSTMDSRPNTCSLVKGDGRVAQFKRSMAKAVVTRLSVSAAW